MGAVSNTEKYWILANKAAKEIGWLPEVIFTQWAWETAHFESPNLLNNNNIGGQTWYEGCGYPKGTARPKAEGGFYIKYPDAAQGYVDFIKKNSKRYGHIKDIQTIEGQIDAIAKAGWATDKGYAKGLKSLHQTNIRLRVYQNPRTEEKPHSEAPVKSEGLGIVEVVCTALNLRTGAGIHHPLVPNREPIKKGEKYRVYGTKDGWYNLGASQWCSGSPSYVKFTKN